MSTFNIFYTTLQQHLLKPLPGKDAQYQMASMLRKQEAPDIETITGFRESAVCILLYEKDGEIVFPLIERVVYEGVHSGQIAFPGGKKDITDRDLQHTAIRELQEEAGVKISDEHILGRLSKLYIPPSNFMVFPFVAFIDKLPDYVLSEYEVQQVLEFPLRELMNDGIIKETTVTVGNGFKIKTPYFDIRGKIVWGATAMILNEFKSVLLSMGS